ncbi:hypothetical protein QTP86_032661 [Hemibagrus guttatus]|nr:hypothetical protein QTP86_032661 [Hemibagrus guttatus]
MGKCKDLSEFHKGQIVMARRIRASPKPQLLWGIPGLQWLKELLRAKLIECGWRDQLKAHCKEVIKEKGIENVTVEDLVAGVTPKGRALVPDSVKKELLQRIRAFLAQHST